MSCRNLIARLAGQPHPRQRSPLAWIPKEATPPLAHQAELETGL